MALVNQYQQTPFTTPVNGAPNDASIVLGNDNAVRGKHNQHDADATIHIQSSLAGDRPAAGVAGRVWLSSDTRTLAYDNGSAWLGVRAAWSDILLDGGALSGVTAQISVTGDIHLDAATSVILGRDAASALSINATTGTTVGASGAASALPALPTGYLSVNINGVARRIPFYN